MWSFKNLKFFRVQLFKQYFTFLKAVWFFESFKAGVKVLPLIILQACTMTPLYQGASHTHAVKIATMPNREGQLLKNELLTLFPNPSQTQSHYRLEPVISFNHQEAGLRRDATAKRQVLTANVSFSLINEANQKAVYQDSVEISTGYNVASSVEMAAVSLVASEKDAHMRLMQQAAQEIKILVESFLINNQRSLQSSTQASLKK